MSTLSDDDDEDDCRLGRGTIGTARSGTGEKMSTTWSTGRGRLSRLHAHCAARNTSKVATIIFDSSDEKLSRVSVT